ncbi:voltage-gated potassium channel [Nonlabens spongiae]|uniref:Voltage-gated potassium channel n=1 Tax=Nonlabens spongiae TaxID=331648 RepID=A0A1W6MLR1_9FLAO|nr:ion transporter [Nonlabens spongiae]ARN78538.1 voltage-gated potassium channel [Nonlabens spongiae]
MREKLRSIVEDNSTRKGKIFDFTIQFLILISLVAYCIETLPNNPIWLNSLLKSFEVVCIVIFSMEYLIRIWVAKNPLRYIFSFYGIIDLIAILPFYLSRFIDARAVRAFRIFRVFRSLKLIRYNKALRRFNIAARLVKEEVILFLITTSIFIFLASAGIYYFENEAQPEVFSSVPHSAWWAVVTLTTVGYGDVYPVTAGGKIFTFFILLIGVGIVTIPAGLVASALSKAREIEKKEREINNQEKEST